MSLPKLPEEWENIIYDTYDQLQRNAKPICELVNEHGTDEQKEAYTNGIYAPAVRLGIFLGREAIVRGKERHEKIEADVKRVMKSMNIKPESK